MQPIEALRTTEAELLHGEDLRFECTNKQRVHAIATSSGATDAEIEVTRWRAIDLPSRVGPEVEVEVRPDVYTYDDDSHWYVNFADRDLFFGWGTHLFAQDELQIAEHPALAALRVRLERTGAVRPRTVGADEPTPVLVSAVPRRLAIDLGPRPDLGLPNGIYGNAFSRASTAAIEALCTPLVPPTRSNLIAIAAPSHGSGGYAPQQIEWILRTAYTGFLASRHETDPFGHVSCVVHTGYWGCGAFGGDRTLMVALQVLAAATARVDTLVVHTVSPHGRADADRGVELARGLFDRPVPDVVEHLMTMDFRWGAGNGT